jgi:hypothetical protein
VCIGNINIKNVTFEVFIFDIYDFVLQLFYRIVIAIAIPFVDGSLAENTIFLYLQIRELV